MKVGIILGTRSQWTTMKHTAELLAYLGIPFEARIITAYKSSKQLHEYASNATNRGLEIIIAGSTGGIYLPGIIASKTDVPVVGLQINNSTTEKNVCGLNSENNLGNTIRILNTGTEGAINAALFAANILAKKHPHIHKQLTKYRSENQADKALQQNFI